MTLFPVLPLPCRKANRRLRVSLRVEDWPAADRDAWHALFTTGDLFDDKGPGSHLAPRTRTSLENAYGRWLGFLARLEPLGLDEAVGARVTRERIISFALHLAETREFGGRSAALVAGRPAPARTRPGLGVAAHDRQADRGARGTAFETPSPAHQ
jgi:hypothetical protein